MQYHDVSDTPCRGVLRIDEPTGSFYDGIKMAHFADGRASSSDRCLPMTVTVDAFSLLLPAARAAKRCPLSLSPASRLNDDIGSAHFSSKHDGKTPRYGSRWVAEKQETQETNRRLLAARQATLYMRHLCNALHVMWHVEGAKPIADCALPITSRRTTQSINHARPLCVPPYVPLNEVSSSRQISVAEDTSS